MRASLLGALTLIAALGLAGSAPAAPYDGARYAGAVAGGATCPGCGESGIAIGVADDGRSLMSAVTATSVVAGCTGRSRPARLRSEPPAATAVKRDRRFRWRAGGSTVRGRFSRDGRSVGGTVTIRRNVRGGHCELGPLRFRLQRRGRPYRGGDCDAVLRQPLRIRAVRTGRGCTPVTRVAVAWREARSCRAADGLPRPCAVAGRRCAPIVRGRLAADASVACRRGGERFELVIERFCAAPGRLAVGALRVSCRTARRVAAAAGADRALRGWRCDEWVPWRGTCTRGRARVWVGDWPFDDFVGDADG